MTKTRQSSEPPLHFVHPGPIAQATGGSIYDRRMLAALRGGGWRIELHELAGEFPVTDGRTQRDAAALLDGLGDGARLLIDGLALHAFAPSLARHADRLRPAALVHHPTSDETGLDAASRRLLQSTERDLLPRLRRVIVPSDAMRQRVAADGVRLERIAVAPPGTDPAPRAVGSQSGAAHLLCVASITPRKGHDRLIEALAACRDLDWRLTCAGPTDRDPDTAARVAQAIAGHDLGDRVALAGELRGPPLDDLYRSADVFVLASAYEGFGMAFAEAMARGLPVVASGDGAVRDTVPEAAGAVVPVGDVPALAAAMGRMIADPAYRRRKADGAYRAGSKLIDWPTAARRFADAIETL
ncbi:MAG: glycosyltransferase family 4 protein [Alphaproteobacteria bacterium]|nr:glycosyltransferase family 4 protein [Alphaproteobacteria bacterium]